MAVIDEWCRTTAIVGDRFAVKFAWTEEAADELQREAAIQRALATTAVSTAELVTTSTTPTLIVCRVVDGRPLTYDDAGRFSRAEVRRVAQAMARQLTAFHEQDLGTALAVEGVVIGAASPQASSDELRDRLPTLLPEAIWQRTERLLARVDTVLARPESAAVVHGDWHGYNLVFDDAFETLCAVLDFGETGTGDVAFDFRYLPRQSPTLDLMDTTLAAYRAEAGRHVDRDRVLAWHVLTDLGDALWRTDAGVEVVAGPIERRARDLHDVLVDSGLQT